MPGARFIKGPDKRALKASPGRRERETSEKSFFPRKMIEKKKYLDSRSGLVPRQARDERDFYYF